jgi:hypothetical protein
MNQEDCLPYKCFPILKHPWTEFAFFMQQCSTHVEQSTDTTVGCGGMQIFTVSLNMNMNIALIFVVPVMVHKLTFTEQIRNFISFRFLKCIPLFSTLSDKRYMFWFIAMQGWATYTTKKITSFVYSIQYKQLSRKLSSKPKTLNRCGEKRGIYLIWVCSEVPFLKHST